VRGVDARPRLPLGARQVGEREEVVALVVGQAQGAGDRGDDLSGCRDRPALLEPRVPGETHAGELRDLLAAESRDAAPRAVGQAHVGRLQPGTSPAEERRELGA